MNPWKNRTHTAIRVLAEEQKAERTHERSRILPNFVYHLVRNTTEFAAHQRIASASLFEGKDMRKTMPNSKKHRKISFECEEFANLLAFRKT